ncbi:hypothetical protein [Nordella sp. HKS 07]|uniref:hypothetical protein n=1 Tax=Nordella sp. HKS 07 TaxID=2712222 RepID=UPI0019D310F2|nr:hypothetical protein [Nordella sp. HKS 07]
MGKIKELRILPPFAIGRLGSAEDPLDNYTIATDAEGPLGYRTIVPAETLIVDEASGEISGTHVPARMQFKRDKKIRPVAPFLELFAVNAKNELVPVTEDLLAGAKLSWRVAVANRKVVRRTRDKADLVSAHTGWFSDHAPQRLKGYCTNFISKDAFVDFGSVRFIKPNEKYPQIRLRFTPAKGLIYGPHAPDAPDPIIPAERAIYDHGKDRGTWYKFEADGKDETVPPSLFAIEPPAPSWLNDNIAISRGYFDDACDGFVEAKLNLSDGHVLTASARICASPPAVVPDSLFVRSLADDLEQVIHGPAVADDEAPEITQARAEDIVRRAFETVRFLNVAVLNGNDYKGRSALSLDSMPEEEAADTERAIRPVITPEGADTLAILTLHQQVYAALRGGAAPWFLRLLRNPDEVSDFTDRGRRKMPALMCGADNSYLALTHRQIDTIRKVAEGTLGTVAAAPKVLALTPRNLTAQIHYEAAGNPVSSRPVTSVANCCPGLEVDFRAIWRRMLEGLELREYDNLIVNADPEFAELKGHRLLRITLPDGQKPIEPMNYIRGPATSDPDGYIILTTAENPYGLAPLEWSNALARLLNGFQGETVDCDISLNAEEAQVPRQEDPPNFKTYRFKVRYFFDPGTAVISEALAEAGELTQGLCSPWQNDYRECSCYYWASARPDFVNVEPGPKGLSHGDNWLQKKRTGQYVADDYVDSRLVFYDELFTDWEKWLRFQVKGRDAPGEERS